MKEEGAVETMVTSGGSFTPIGITKMELALVLEDTRIISIIDLGAMLVVTAGDTKEDIIQVIEAEEAITNTEITTEEKNHIRTTITVEVSIKAADSDREKAMSRGLVPG